MPGSAVASGDAGPCVHTYDKSVQLEDDDYLDLSKGNYMSWQRRMKMELGMSVPHIEEYLEATMNAPNPLLQPCALRNFQRNSYSIVSCMKFRCCETEQELIEDLMTANEVWAFLKGRHMKQGTMHRVLLEDEFLAMRMDTDPNGDLLASWIEMQRLHKQIHAMGEIDPLAHLMIGALSLTRSQLVLWDYICNTISAEKADSRFTADQVTERIRLMMQLAKGSVSTALVATTNTGIKRKITTCTNCGKRGHHMESCISAGGGMAGKTITEAQAAMGKKKRKVDPPQANIATSAAPPAPPTSANGLLVTARMRLHYTRSYLPSCLDRNCWPLTTSLDWALQSHQVAANAMTAAIVEHTSAIKRWIFTRHPGGLTVVHQPTSPRKGVISSNFTRLSPVVFKVLVDHPYLLWG
ncbi:Copia protein [Salix suchowensis]|nr:Copia protein [Salix suchowensis]